VVGTPGRLCDHIRRGRLRLDELRVLVLDEADEMLDLGFRDELDQIFAATPEGRRTLLFSATIAKDIIGLARQYQQDALRIDTLVRNQPHADIEYRAVRVLPREIELAVVNVLRYVDAPTALVFCATRDGVRHLHASLMERGFTSVALSGELTQNERSRALQAMRDGQARVCVATDVAARGLDLPDLGLVIHADMPTSKQTLLHRSGRTGRAGRKGVCVVIVPVNRTRAAETLFSSAALSASWSGPPSAEDIRALDGKRLLADPILTEEPSADDLVLAEEVLAGRSAAEIAAALIRLYRARLPAAEEVSETSAIAPRRAPAETYENTSRPKRPGPGSEKTPRPSGPMMWFSLSVGRQAKADPKWILPVICRVGGVEKGDVGAIRILDRETRFEIRADIAEDFFANASADGSADARVTRSEAPGMAARSGPAAGKAVYRKRK
jgi:ATP-dependent RNA helicase DeaD